MSTSTHQIASPESESRFDTVDETESSIWSSDPGLECNEVWLDDRRFGDVRCEILPHRVILRGAVASFHLKQLAQEHLLHRDNPREIVNLIEVRR